MIPKWDFRFLKLSLEVSTWSKDPSTKAGAVVVQGKNDLVIPGYNGFAKQVADSPERYDNRDIKYKLVRHAERNAVGSALQARADMALCTLYCTHYPCSSCASDIVQYGIRRVVTFQPEGGYKERWLEEMQASEMQFKDTGVEVITYDMEEYKATLVQTDMG